MTIQTHLMFESSTKNLTEQLEGLHSDILERFPEIVRIACTLYDPDTDLLKTFINSTHSGHAISGYEYPLSKSSSLTELVDSHSCRFIDDISTSIPQDNNEHSNWLLEQGYKSSFTVPMISESSFIGFIFIDSKTTAYFSETVQRDLLLFCNLITMSISASISAVHSLLATAQAARDFADLRDFETGAHLTRMAQLSRLIAKQLPEIFHITDEQIEYIYLFAPLHDIGKIGTPDNILLKPGALSPNEMSIMRQHVQQGISIIQKVLNEYQLIHLEDSQVMLNIVAYHHEFMDGSGYPHGLKGDEIPVEARIITVADIFDALTSKRPYKEPWSVEDAFSELQRMVEAGKLDGQCVSALIAQEEEVKHIITTFVDTDSEDFDLS